MTNTPIKEVHAYEGHAIEVRGDDGPEALLLPRLEVVAKDGRHFALPNDLKKGESEDGFTFFEFRFSLDKARELSDVISSRGFINAEHWVEFQPDTRSMEDKAFDDYEAECNDRREGGAA